MKKIFISLASYIDSLLGFTIKNALDTAIHPQRLVFGVIDQNLKSQRDALATVPFAKQVRYCHINVLDTLGVSWARSLVFSLYDGEEYLLQVDSHTLFEKGWDENLISQHQNLKAISQRPIISTYPYSFTIEENKPIFKTPEGKTVLVLRPHPDTPLTPESVVMRFKAKHLFTKEPVLGCHMAGGFIFCEGEFVGEVPYDPYLYFHGEEQSLSLRAYTRGWDIYHPIWIPLYHFYKQANVSHITHHWHQDIKDKRDFNMQELQTRARERIKKLIRGELDRSAYGLGKERTLEDYKQISGIDYKEFTITEPYKNLC